MYATKTRKAERHRRRQLLKQIDQWERKRCDTCTGNTKNLSQSFCECEAAVEIRNLGIQLSENRISTFSTERELAPKKPVEELTPESYKRLKEKEFYTDKEIMLHFEIGSTRFARFKRENDLVEVGNHLKSLQRQKLSSSRELNGLTTEKYKELRRKGVVDLAIAEDFGISKSTFTRWKRTHGLNNYKRKPENEEEKNMVTVTTDAIKELSSSSVDSKEQPRIDKSDLQPARPFATPADLQILADMVKPLKTSPEDDSEVIGGLSVGLPQTSNVPFNPSNSVNLIQLERDEAKAEIAALEGRHVLDGERIYKLREEVKRLEEERLKERACSEMWRDKFLNAERDCKAKEIDLANLKYEVKKQDDLLIASDRDEQLLFAVMEKAVNLRNRLGETVEGGADKWR